MMIIFSLYRKFHCIAFMECMFKHKKLLDYKNFFPPNDYKRMAR